MSAVCLHFTEVVQPKPKRQETMDMDDEFVEACLKDSCYFRTVTVDLPRLDEKLVKTYLNFQLPEINPEPQSPGTTAIRGVGNEDKHLPWQISSNIEGTMCKICGSVQQTKHDIYRHIRNVHLKMKVFQCNDCDFATERIGLLKVHFKTNHANEKSKQQTVQEVRFHEKKVINNDNVVIDTTKPTITIKEDMSIKDILAMDLETAALPVPVGSGKVISKFTDPIQCEVCNYVPQNKNGKSARKKNLDTHYKSQKHISTWKKIMEDSAIFEQTMLDEENEEHKFPIPSVEESFQNSYQNSSTNDSGFVEQESMGEQTILDKFNTSEIETSKNQLHESFLHENDFTKKPEKVDVVEEENRFSCVLSYQCRQRFRTTLDVENHGVKFHKSLGICKKDINEILLADFLKSESKRLKTFTGNVLLLISYFHKQIESAQKKIREIDCTERKISYFEAVLTYF